MATPTFPHLRTHVHPDGTTLATLSVSLLVVDLALVQAAEQELLRKSMLAQAGIDEPSACEKLVYQLLTKAR